CAAQRQAIRRPVLRTASEPRRGASRLRLREDSKDVGQTSRRQAVPKPLLRRQSASTGSVGVRTPIPRRRGPKRAWWLAACQNFIRKAVQVHNGQRKADLYRAALTQTPALRT